MTTQRGGILGRGIAWFKNQELIVLLAMLGLALALLAFFQLADELREGTTQSFDESVVKALRDPINPLVPIGPRWLQNAVRDITALGSTTVLTLMTISVGGFLVLRRQFHAFFFLAVAMGGGLLLNYLLKAFFDRPRPSIVPHLDHVRNASFPSGHSLLAAVVYLTLAVLLARLATQRRQRLYVVATALFITVLVGASRVYLGVHYPTDVAAGWCAGSGWAICCWFAVRSLQRRGTVERTQTDPPK